VRTLQEIRDMLDALTVKQVRDFAVEYAPQAMALVTIGPAALDAACVAGT